MRLRGSLGFAGRFPSWPTAVCACITLWLCVAHGLRRGLRVLVLYSVAPYSGALSLSSLAPYTGFSPRPLLTARPPPSRPGGGGGLPCSSGLLVVYVVGGLLRACGLSCCPHRFGCSLGLLHGAVKSYSYYRSLPLGSCPGMSLSLCAHACVLCTYVSPRLTCVLGCVQGCGCRSPLFCCPPAASFFLEAYKNGGRPSFTPWVSTSAGLVLSPVSARWCLLRGSVSLSFLSDVLVPCHCRIPCLSGVA